MRKTSISICASILLIGIAKSEAAGPVSMIRLTDESQLETVHLQIPGLGTAVENFKAKSAERFANVSEPHGRQRLMPG